MIGGDRYAIVFASLRNETEGVSAYYYDLNEKDGPQPHKVKLPWQLARLTKIFCKNALDTSYVCLFDSTDSTRIIRFQLQEGPTIKTISEITLLKYKNSQITDVLFSDRLDYVIVLARNQLSSSKRGPTVDTQDTLGLLYYPVNLTSMQGDEIDYFVKGSLSLVASGYQSNRLKMSLVAGADG